MKKKQTTIFKKEIWEKHIEKQQSQKTMERKPNFKENLSLEKFLKENSKL